MLPMQFEIQFIGHRFTAMNLLKKYFGGNVVVSENSVCVFDKYTRSWSVTYCDDIDLKSDNTDSMMYKNVLVTPFMNLSDINDVMLLHDILLLFRMDDDISINDSCAMRINITAPVDKRKLALYFEEYTKYQYEQVRVFDTTVSGPWGFAKLYKYSVCGYELDNVNDILLVIMANYASPGDSDLEFASGFALNFAKVITDDQLQFRAFNSSFDDDYVFSAANWVCDFLQHCDELWENGWRQEYERLRQVYTSI